MLGHIRIFGFPASPLANLKKLLARAKVLDSCSCLEEFRIISHAKTSWLASDLERPSVDASSMRRASVFAWLRALGPYCLTREAREIASVNRSSGLGRVSGCSQFSTDCNNCFRTAWATTFRSEPRACGQSWDGRSSQAGKLINQARHFGVLCQICLRIEPISPKPQERRVACPTCRKEQRGKQECDEDFFLELSIVGGIVPKTPLCSKSKRTAEYRTRNIE